MKDPEKRLINEKKSKGTNVLRHSNIRVAMTKLFQLST